MTVLERIVAALGRRIDESNPLVDARLQDGSRVNAIIPPLAIDGPALTIRKFGKRALTSDDPLKYQAITQEMVDFLKTSVLIRKNILISGGTGSGKTTLLNTLSSFIPSSERIVIGECRGGEAFDMLQAMNTGHDGSLTTIHANSPRDALARLVTLVLMAGFDSPLRAVREQVASAITLIVQVNRFKDGSRKISSITEVTGMEGEIIATQEIFSFSQERIAENGRVKGQFIAQGVVPTFTEEIIATGLPVDLSIFRKIRTDMEATDSLIACLVALSIGLGTWSIGTIA